MPDPNESAKKIWEWLFSKSYITWAGHALQMVLLLGAIHLFGGVGAGAVFMAYFAVREYNDFKKGSPPFDCIMDFASPAVIYLLYVRFLA